MKMTTGLMAGASRFAHFAGLSRASASRRAADEDDDQKQGRRADDDDDADGDDDKPAGKRSRRAADDDDDKGGNASADDDGDGDDDDDDNGKGAEDGDDDSDDEKPAGKRSRRAAEDDDKDDDEDEMKGKSATASARRREQARIAHILGHKAAAGNPLLAISLACETRMTRQEAVRVLRSTPASQQAANDRPNRHARTDRNVSLGSDPSVPSGRQAVEASWDKAFAKAGIPKAR